MLECVLLDVLDVASVHIEFTSVSGRWWRMEDCVCDDISDGTVVLRCKGIGLEESWFIAVTKRIFPSLRSQLTSKYEAGRPRPYI